MLRCYLEITSNSTFKGIGSLNMDSTGQFASVLLQAPSSNSFLAVAQTLVLIVTPVSTGESAGFSASATASTLLSSILLCLQTSANIVTAQSARAIKVNSRAGGMFKRTLFRKVHSVETGNLLCVMDASLPRKDIVRVILSRQQREILWQISERLGQSESETMRTAFMDYAKSINLITEKVHSKQNLTIITEITNLHVRPFRWGRPPLS